jgi:DNA polymerase III subunit delta'
MSAHSDEGVVDPWDIPGQGSAADVLRRAAVNGEVGHAWAFLGPPGVGQEQAARALTATLVCRADARPCGTCDVCRRSLRGTHPAYLEFVPTGAVHRVSDVRERWLRIAAHSAGEGGWKVLRIVDAERMNDAAANAFLKGLEEPPPGTVWILDVADPEDLPDTILSRCRAVRFAPLDQSTLDAEARRAGIEDPVERALAVRVSLGAASRLRTLAEDGVEDVRAHREIPRRLTDQGFALVAAKRIEEEVTRRTATVKEEGKAAKEALSEGYGEAPPRAVLRELEERNVRKEREARTVVVQQALDDIACWYRDALLVGRGADDAALVHGDDIEALRDTARSTGPATLLRALDLVMATRASLERNVQPRLALEALFLDLSALSLAR